MVHTKQSQIVLVIFLFFSCGIHAMRPATTFKIPENFYTFIEWEGYKGYKESMVLELHQTMTNIDTLKLKKVNLTEEDYEAQYQGLVSQLELEYDDWVNKNTENLKNWKKEIAKQCKKKRKELDEKLKETRDLLEKLEEPELSEKREEYGKLDRDVKMARQACIVLMNDKNRREHDLNLQLPQEKSEDYFDSVRESVVRAQILAPDKKVVLNQLIGDMLLPWLGDISGPATTLFNQNIALKSIRFLPMPYGPDVQYGIGFSGLLEFNRFDLRVSVYIAQSLYGKVKFSIAVELPEHYKLSHLIPGFTFLDAFSFPRSKLVYSTFFYADQSSGSNSPVERGLNFIAEVDLTGPLAILSDLKEKSKYSRSFVFDNKPVILHGVLPPPKNILDAKFDVHVPFYFGIDLTKVSAIPTIFSKKVKQITTDEFRLEISPVERKSFAEKKKEAEKMVEVVQPEKVYPHPGIVRALEGQKKIMQYPKFVIEAEAGARIVLGTQLDPIKLTLLGIIKPSLDPERSSLFMAGNLKNMVQLKWLALGDATIQLGWEAELMEQAKKEGLPFTDVGVRGRVDLGKPGESRAYFNAAGGIRLSAEESILKYNLLFSLDGKNIRFADLVQYVSYLASQAKILKSPFSIDRIPTMTFHRVWGEASLADRPMRIGKTLYFPGLRLQVETELFNKKFGFKVAISDAFRLSGFGYIPRFDISIKNRDLFKLYGLEIGKGPRLNFNFDPTEPSQGYFNLNGALEIPALRLKQEVNFLWYGWKLDADFESKIAGLAVVFGVSINLKAGVVPEKSVEDVEIKKEGEIGLEEKEEFKPDPGKKWRQMYVRFGFKDDFAEYMTTAARGVLQKMRDNAYKKLEAFAQKMNEWQEQGIQVAEREVESVRQSIAKTEEKIKQAKEQCAQAKWYKKALCARLIAQESVLAIKKSYLQALLKPKHAVSRGVRQTTAQVADMIAKAQKVRRAIEAVLDGAITGLDLIKKGITIFRVKEVIGEFSSEDLIPRLRSLVIEVNIFDKPSIYTFSNIQFDFKNVGQSIENIVGQVIFASQNRWVGYAGQIADIG